MAEPTADECWGDPWKVAALRSVEGPARAAFAALMALSDEQRGLVLCWFCRGCNRYVGPGDTCYCERDD